MLRFTLKFPPHGLPRFQKYGNSRLLSVSYPYSQKSYPEPTSSRSNKQREDRTRGGGGTGFYYTLGVLSFATGATLVYAKYDPDFRKWLGTQAPWSENILEVVLQEKESWGDAFQKVLDGVSRRTHRLISGSSQSTSRKEESKSTVCDEDKERREFTPPRSVFSALLSQSEGTDKPWAEVRVLPEPTSGTQPNPEIVAGEREKPPADDPATLPVTHPVNLVDLEKKVQESATTAIKSYHDAACAVRETSLDVLKIIEQSVAQTDDKGMQKIKAKFEKKSALVQEAEDKAQAAIDTVTKLKEIVEGKKLDAPEHMKMSALRNVERVIEEINSAQEELEQEKKNSSLTEKYWKKVEISRKHYIDELLILFPDVRLSEKEWRINKHDLDLFIYYCFQNVLYYQKELAKLETVRAEKLNTALKGSEEKVDKEVFDAAIAEALERQKRDLEVEFQKKILEVRQTTEKDMRLQLKRQTEAHNDHLCDALSLQEKELQRKFARDEEEKIAEEKDKFKHQLAGLVGRLQGLESALKARAHVDKNAHQAQVLWSACQALHSALKHSDPGVPWQDQLRPLENEITAVRKAALEDDELVKAVLEGIPSQAKKRGVYSEAALRERFLQVERSARRVALVPNEGASLPVYFLSYLQSALLIKALNPIPEAELQNEPTNFECMDTYDILQRSRYWMERGNVEQTLRYMTLLSGASRAVAQDWMSEARVFLETKQAATVLMTHAAAAGLLYI